MLTEPLLLIGGLAAALFAALLTLHESRAIARADAPLSSETSSPPPPPPPPADELCIASQRARCSCGHAMESHPACLDGRCPCREFQYAGGLVSLDYQFLRPTRPRLLPHDEREERRSRRRSA